MNNFKHTACWLDTTAGILSPRHDVVVVIVVNVHVIWGLSLHSVTGKAYGLSHVTININHSYDNSRRGDYRENITKQQVTGCLLCIKTYHLCAVSKIRERDGRRLRKDCEKLQWIMKGWNVTLYNMVNHCMVWLVITNRIMGRIQEGLQKCNQGLVLSAALGMIRWKEMCESCLCRWICDYFQ